MGSGAGRGQRPYRRRAAAHGFAGGCRAWCGGDQHEDVAGRDRRADLDRHVGHHPFGLRDDQWDYDIISQWLNPEESAHHIQWTREFWTAVEPFATGEVYVNHLDAEEGTRIRAAYSDNYERLVALKNKYDPTNLFRLNQNIKPTV